MIDQLELVVMQQITVTKESWNLSSIRSCSQFSNSTLYTYKLWLKKLEIIFIALLEIVLLLLSLTSIISVEYELEGVLDELEIDMDVKTAYIP